MNKKTLRDLDELLHTKARLGIMTLLVSLGENDFSTLKSYLGLTDGNLGAHLRVLEEAGHLEVEKKFAGRRPKTLYRVTESGEKAFLAYLRQLETVINMVDPGDKVDPGDSANRP